MLLIIFLIMPSFCSNDLVVTVILNKSVAPFNLIQKELKAELKGVRINIFDVKNLPPKIEGEYLVTIGAESYKAVLPLKSNSKLIYTMVLSYDENYKKDPNVVGVAMVPSFKREFQILKKFANINYLTIFFNPIRSKRIVEDIKKSSVEGVEIKFVEVPSEKDFLRILDSSFPISGAILLIPDPTILTEQGIKKMVFKSYEKKVPIVGFSPMYIDLGAALSIYVSERQTAKTVASIIYGENQELWDRTDGLIYPRLCEIKFSKKAGLKLSMNFDLKQLELEGVSFEGVE